MYRFAKRFDGIGGSEIRKIFGLLAVPDMISFAGGNPSPELFPAETLAEISEEIIAENGKSVLQYGGTLGVPAFIELLKYRNADIMRETDDIVVTSGSSQGIDFFAHTMIEKGDVMLAESPSFLGALQTFRLADADVKTVTMEEDGISTTELEEKIKQYNPKFLYTIPTFQNPSGITMSGEKRQKVYDICKKYGVLILEDDPYAELRYSGQALESIKSYDDSGIVCKLASFSKTISPGLRVGYAIANKEIIAKFNLLKQGADVHTSNLTQTMVMEFLKRGYYDEHVKMLCTEYRKQRDAMCGAIDKYFPQGAKRTNPDGGLFVWVTLPEGVNARALFEECVNEKVAFVVGPPFFAEGGHENTLRMNFSMPSIPDIEKGVEKMGRIIRDFV
ncbi:MAG: PLP-dependent aminotransferase family protein [Christensenella sp.]|uniref:aminotransferase-like domain-containing protein n=1 Tax=Christensenella sp. TaxID=1935934 RepID=UPI002B21E0AD|nr:PLP-dependent aminotransferase family protein [Christensenella sp.]MEA5002933.1 PLP-dependent aminotransferase family protein [Christensenella sp.]